MPLNPVNGSPNPDILQGTQVADLILAGAGNDVAQGLDGNDVMRGQGGSDELFGNGGNDRIYGGAGDDFISGDLGEDWLYGDDGNDYLQVGVHGTDLDENHAFGGGGNDIIEFYLSQRGNGEADGGDGVDRLMLGPFNITREVSTPLIVTLNGPGAGVSYDSDHGEHVTISLTSIEALTLSASFGDDVINTNENGDYHDYVRAGDGANTVNTYGGNDFISYLHKEPGQVNTIDGGTGDDTLRIDTDVWAFEDPTLTFTVTGTTATDNFGAIISNVENFEIYGSAGDDTATFGAGDDEFHGAQGNDEATGNAGDDLLFGDEGNDRLFGNAGSDVLDGGFGDDHLNGGTDDDLLIGGDGGDRILGGGGNDEIFTGEKFSLSIITGTEYVDAGAGDDMVWASVESGSELLGGDGFDTLFLVTQRVPGPLVLDLSGAGPSDILISGFEAVTLHMGSFDDHITGTSFADNIHVGSGRNTVFSGDGDDIVGTHYGSDHEVDGGDGNDLLQLGMYFKWDSAALVFTADATGATDNFGASYTGFEIYNILGNYLDDSITLGVGNDTGSGRHGDDSIAGGDGNDKLLGGLGEDVLDGGAGDDILNGAEDFDTLTGGTGADKFRFIYKFPPQPADLITDMESGVDRIQISIVYTNFTVPVGLLDPSHFSLGAAVGSAGQFVYVTDAGGGHLLWDADGDGAAAGSEVVTLAGAPIITAGDIQII